MTDPNDSTNTLVFQSKGAWVSGVEAEATYYFGDGLSAYANGSLNRATFKTDPGFRLSTSHRSARFGGPNASRTRPAAMGLVYNRSGWFASLDDKYVGPFVIYSSALVNPDLGLYGQTSTGQPGGPRFRSPPPISRASGSMNVAVGYAYKLPKGSFLHSVKIKLEVDNILDREVQVLSSVGATAAADTFNVLPDRSYFLTLSSEF